MARTAVVAGTATAVSGRVARRQNQRWAQQEQQAEPQYQQPPPQQYAAPPPAEDPRDKQIAQLKELADLKAQGILTEEEFAAQKAQILGG
jgi:hypothetical protein